jgi:hypothetical protein
MSYKPKQRWFLPVAFSMAFLLLSLPAQARPSRRPLADTWKKLAVLSDSVLARVGNLLGLWQQGVVKEGMSIDPNGTSQPSGTSSDPQGGSGDEGATIDPNGKP